jgi:hypothetical protein
MGYVGTTIPIPLGQIGLMTDLPMGQIPPNAAIVATNVSINNNRIEKSPGSTKYNSTVLPASVVAVYDWWPTASLQRLIAVTSDGKIFRDTGDGTFSTATAITTGLGTLDNTVCMVSGGNEAGGSDKRLFIFTGTNQVRYITADGSSTTALGAGELAADWASNYPTFGIIHANRLWAFGNSNARHRIYASNPANHKDFATTDYLTFEVFPGEGDGIYSARVYKGRLFLFKKPGGVYYVDTSDPSDANWSVIKVDGSFGVASPHAVVQLLDDMIAANNNGSYTSLAATDALGDVKAGDILTNTMTENYFRDEFDASGIQLTHAVYYQEKKKALFSARSTTSGSPDRLLIIDANRTPVRITMESKDSPRCLALRKDSNLVPRPIYGADDGYVYLWDQETRLVGTTPYTGEFQTPYMDFSFVDASLTTKNKTFDFLEVHYVVTGDYSFFVDYYIDNVYVDTLEIEQSASSTLGSFVLGTDVLGTTLPNKTRKRLRGSGETISFKIYNASASQTFTVEKISVSFRVAGEEDKE